MAAVVTTSVIFRSLKATLDDIFTDDLARAKKSRVFPKYLEETNMSDEYDDDLEMAGPGLATEKKEAQDIEVGDIMEGSPTRYKARTFALRVIVSEEALEDSKYQKTIDAASRLTWSAIKTQEYDAANVLNRAATSGYTGGDGVTLASASHTLPSGGTYSNQLSTGMAPGRIAVQLARAALRKMIGPSGLIEGYMATGVICPVDQESDWEIILGSPNVPESANNGINPVKGMKLDLIPVPYWTSTTTAWGLKTDAPSGGKWKWRRKMRQKSYVDEDAEVLKYKVSYRAARGWTNPRWFFYSPA